VFWVWSGCGLTHEGDHSFAVKMKCICRLVLNLEGLGGGQKAHWVPREQL
jgi:hypothetical protein